MAITILAPAPAIPYQREASSEESDDGGVDLEGDLDMRPAKWARHRSKDIVTPGETVTDDPQWMRHIHPTFKSFRICIVNKYPEATAHSLLLQAPR
jgi:hypothetical protein